MEILLMTDGEDFESSLPTLALFGRCVHRVPLTAAPDADGLDPHDSPDADSWDADVAVVDARTDLAAAREMCRRLAAGAPSMAVVAVLTAENFVAVGLDWHVDDVFSPDTCAAELYARLRLAAARRRHEVEHIVRIGDLVVRPASYTASVADHRLDLTPIEFKLLNHLVQHAGRALSRTRLLHEVWGHDCSRRTVDVHVQRLRAKLGAQNESIIGTVRGVGYMVAAPVGGTDGDGPAAPDEFDLGIADAADDVVAATR